MTQLWEITKLIRSKNAGPWELTIDLMFKDVAGYELAAASELGSPHTYADLYQVDLATVRVFRHPAALAIKVTIPRPDAAGGPAETDVFGGQFHSPLVRYELGRGGAR